MKIMILKLIKIMLIPVGMLYTLFSDESGTVILMYHRVNDSVKKELSVKRTDFIWHMNYLHRKGYKVITLDDAIKLYGSGNNRHKEGTTENNCRDINEKEIYEEKAVERNKGKFAVLTFDDGYEDYFTAAFPILSNFCYPSIVFLVPGFIEKGRIFWWDRDIGESRLMKWEQMRIIERSCAVRLPYSDSQDFTQINRMQAERELVLSRDRLEEKLSRRIKHFAYPRGIVKEEYKDIVGKIYQTGLSIFEGYKLSGRLTKNELLQLKRLPVQRGDGRLLFAPRIRGWLIAEEWIKKLMGRH